MMLNRRNYKKDTQTGNTDKEQVKLQETGERNE